MSAQRLVADSPLVPTVWEPVTSPGLLLLGFATAAVILCAIIFLLRLPRPRSSRIAAGESTAAAAVARQDDESTTGSP